MPDARDILFSALSPDEDAAARAKAYAQGLPDDQTAQAPSFRQRLGETTIARLGRAMMGAVTAPGDAYSGNLQVMDPATGHASDEAIQRSTDLAGFLTAGAGSVPGAANELRAGFTLNHFGQPVKILENPSPKELTGFINRTKFKAARRLKDPETGTTYVWDAGDPAMHANVAEQLGVKFDPKFADIIGSD